MRVMTGKVVSLWIENRTNPHQIGLAIMIPDSLKYLVHTVHDSMDSAPYHHLGDIIQVDLDTDHIVYN